MGEVAVIENKIPLTSPQSRIKRQFRRWFAPKPLMPKPLWRQDKNEVLMWVMLSTYFPQTRPV
ncbi:hypothetical protein Rcae01_02233 [Novipirellula caenicola]|uniref:Uncharacterized protein n=1 Tax=Novipirellula caenicola TaxID=1536901 RepID=A0ABP9VR52_9BACT